MCTVNKVNQNSKNLYWQQAFHANILNKIIENVTIIKCKQKKKTIPRGHDLS